MALLRQTFVNRIPRMKKTELRIGNIIKTDTLDIVEIFELRENKARIKQENGHISMIDYERLFGDEITTDWLETFGFVWSIQHQAYHKNRFEYVIDFYENHPQTNGNLAFLKKNHRNGETLIALKHVHELQNLHFALTQTELNAN